jgi:hypothetical protein
MELNASQINTETASDVNTALNLTDQYASSGLDKVAQIATLVGGEEVKKYGLTTENLKRVMIFVGAYTTLRYGYEKAGKYKFKVLGALIGIYAIRTMITSKENSTIAKTNPSSIINPPIV